MLERTDLPKKEPTVFEVVDPDHHPAMPSEFYLLDHWVKGSIPLETEADLIAACAPIELGEVRMLFQIMEDDLDCVDSYSDVVGRCIHCRTGAYAAGKVDARGRPIGVPYWTQRQRWWSQELSSHGVEWDPALRL